MYDNGLLKYYRQNALGGFLDTTKIGFVKNFDMLISSVTQCSIDGKKFYAKKLGIADNLYKPRADAEILLCQVYSKLGVPSSIYTPAQSQDEQFLLCDDVEKDNVMLATNYLASKFSLTKPRLMPFLSQGRVGANPYRYFTKEAMAEQTKMRILDTASYNTDRHMANFFYTLQRDIKPEQDGTLGEQIVSYFRALVPNRATGVVAIDFESSGGNINSMIESDSPLNGYMNDFQNSTMTRQEILDQIQNNEKLESVLDKQDFAEEIGSVNIPSIADDIKEITGYEVDAKMVDILSSSYDVMAELLVK